MQESMRDWYEQKRSYGDPRERDKLIPGQIDVVPDIENTGLPKSLRAIRRQRELIDKTANEIVSILTNSELTQVERASKLEALIKSDKDVGFKALLQVSGSRKNFRLEEALEKLYPNSLPPGEVCEVLPQEVFNALKENRKRKEPNRDKAVLESPEAKGGKEVLASLSPTPGCQVSELRPSVLAEVNALKAAMEAIEGAGTDAPAVLQVLERNAGPRMTRLREVWAQEFGSSLDREVLDELGDGFLSNSPATDEKIPPRTFDFGPGGLISLNYSDYHYARAILSDNREEIGYCGLLHYGANREKAACLKILLNYTPEELQKIDLRYRQESKPGDSLEKFLLQKMDTRLLPTSDVANDFKRWTSKLLAQDRIAALVDIIGVNAGRSGEDAATIVKAAISTITPEQKVPFEEAIKGNFGGQDIQQLLSSPNWSLEDKMEARAIYTGDQDLAFASKLHRGIKEAGNLARLSEYREIFAALEDVYREDIGEIIKTSFGYDFLEQIKRNEEALKLNNPGRSVN
ncbi:MAG: hypothetical protein DCC75_09370 [Proteobacteria bacterium]|nr:MAG: hypothetical protein DCC75_09370 [Pseudomonadota bacterium]